MGGVRNGAAEEDWHWDLNPGAAAIPGRTMWLWWRRLGPHSSGRGWDHTAWLELGPGGLGVLPFAMWLRQQERLCLEEKGRKDSCWWATRRCHMALD